MKSPRGRRPGRHLICATLAVAATWISAFPPATRTPTRETGPTKPSEAIALGEARWREGNFQSAFDWMKEALALARGTASLADDGRCLTRLARLSWALGKPADSRKYYDEALADALSVEDLDLGRQSRIGIRILDLYDGAKAEHEAGRPAGSVKLLEEAVKWSRRLASPEHEVRCLRQLALACWAMGQRDRFLSLNQRALGIARGLRDVELQAKFLLNLGTYDFEVRNYSRALNDYSEAADLSRDSGNRVDELACFKNIATILTELGFYERAGNYFQAAYAMDRQLENGYVAQDLNLRGQASRARGLVLSDKEETYRSIDFFTGALAIAQANRDVPTQLVSLNHLGLACQELGYHHTALHYFEEALEELHEFGDIASKANILINIGICGLETGSPRKALGYLDEALRLADGTHDYANLWKVLFYLGQVQERLGHAKDAVTCYRSSIDAIDFVRSQLRLDEFKTGFARNKARVYESLVSLLFKERGGMERAARDAEIFAAVEKAKATAFLETLSEEDDPRSQAPEPQLRSQEESLSGEIADLISRTSRSDLDRPQKLKLEAELGRKEETYLRLLSRRRPGSREMGAPEYPLPIQAADVQRNLLDEKSAVLDYYLRKDLSLLALVTKNDLRIVELPPRETIQRSVGAYIGLLSEPTPARWKGQAASGRLSGILLTEALRLLPRGIENLIIVPDGTIAGLPFETLPLPSSAPDAANDYLIRRYAVSYGASCSSLIFLKERERKEPYSKALLAMGDPSYGPVASRLGGPLSGWRLMRELYESLGFRLDPLGKSKAEVRSIAALFAGKSADVYIGDDASVARLKQARLEEYRVLHFACHAYEDERVPFRSGLFLSTSRGGDGDGFLYARDVAGLRTRAELVVLSACRTNRGYVEEGEGVMGLARAFFYAGADSVVSSLWEVSDRASAEFMPRFYRHLVLGETKARALRSAKLEMLKAGYDHPFYWAAFILAGEPFGRID